MNKPVLLIAALLLCLSGGYASGLDLPFDLGFQLGFNVRVVPSQRDASRQLVLYVKPERIYTNKIHSLTVSGTITNFSDFQMDHVDMGFAVTSYVGTGVSRGSAVIEPNSIPPGGSANFVARINLNSEYPRWATYTVTAQPVYVHVEKPAVTGPIPVSPLEKYLPEVVVEPTIVEPPPDQSLPDLVIDSVDADEFDEME